MSIGLRGIQHLPWEFKSAVFKACGYEPFGDQGPFHRSTASHRILVGGNRSGKTHCLSREVTPYLFVPSSFGWVVAKHYSLCDPIMDAVIEALILLDHNPRPRAQNLKLGEFSYSRKDHRLVTWTGAVLEAKSGDNPDSLHARALDYCIVDEAALFSYYLYQTRLIPRLVDSGGWLAAIGTFEYDTGLWFEELWRIGQQPNDRSLESFTHPTTLNPYVNQAWLEEQKKNLDPNIFAARFLTIPMPSPLRVLHNFSHVENVSINAAYRPGDPVYLAIDPGATYAITALQVWRDETAQAHVNVIDEVYEEAALGTRLMLSKCRKRAWWKSVGHVDTSGVIDVMAYEQRIIWNEALRREGRQPLQSRKVRIALNAQNLNFWLHHRRLLVHPACEKVQREAQLWQYPDLRRGDSFARVPKDKFNHAWKAIGYFLVTKFGLIDAKPHEGISRPRPRWGDPRRGRGIRV